MDSSEVATSPSDTEAAGAPSKRPTHYLVVPALPFLASLMKSNYLPSCCVPSEKLQKLKKYRARKERHRTKTKWSAKSQDKTMDIGDGITM